MSETAPALSKARSPARLFRAWTLWAGVLALFLTFRVWQITEDLDTAVTTLALCLGAAWQIRLLIPQIEQRPSSLGRLACSALLALVLWQLAGIGSSDFWYLRVALIACGALWLLLVWGVAGLIWGWRILAAFILWAALCDGPWQWSRDAYQVGDQIGPKLAIFTAQLAGWLLSQGGGAVAVQGPIIHFGKFAVLVGVPCTALPLVKLLLLLLALATLLFRLELLSALRIAVLTTGIAFVISVVRVMLLAVVVKDPPTFHYWHDADQPGGGWFTAVGMLLMAFLIARQVFRQVGVSPFIAESRLAPAVPPLRWLGLVVVIGLISCCWPKSASPSAALPPVAPLGLSPVEDRTETKFAADSGSIAPDKAATIRHLTYRITGGSTRLEVIIANLPQTLTGNPLGHPDLTALLPASGDWALSPDRQYFSRHSPTGAAWLTTLAQDGTQVATDQAWTEHLRRLVRQPARWVAWFAHRQPLRDKRAYWVAAFTDQPDLPLQPPNLFSAWVAVLPKSR